VTSGTLLLLRGSSSTKFWEAFKCC